MATDSAPINSILTKLRQFLPIPAHSGQLITLNEPNRMLKSLSLGVGLALATILFARLLPTDWVRPLFGIVLAGIAAIYVGFALNDGRLPPLLVEGSVALLFLGMALLGCCYSTGWLVGGYVVHGVWDLIHRPGGIQTRIVKGYPPFCLIYDWVVAVYMFWLWN